MKKAVRMASVGALCWLFFGALFYPYWYYKLIFDKGFLNGGHWWLGITSDVQELGVYTLFTFVTIWSLAVLSRTSLPDKMLLFTQTFWSSYVVGSKSWIVIAALLGGSVLTVSLVEYRSRDDRALEQRTEDLQKQIAESQANLAKSLASVNANEDDVSLSEPTTFVFLDKDVVESLYGQYGPELIPALVIEEIKNSAEIKAGASVEGYLSTEAGKQQFSSKMTQFKGAEKNTERKLQELTKYLNEKGLVKRFSGAKPNSPDLKVLDDATQLLTQKYDLVIDRRKLTLLRDRFLVNEKANLEDQLRVLHGLVIVQGDWLVESKPNTFLLREPFMEDVINPPLCEVTLKKDMVPDRSREILEKIGQNRMRLAVFGNVLVGTSPHSNTVLLSPIAVF